VRQSSRIVRAALISEGFMALPLYVAQGRGLFAAHGLEVSLTVTGSSAKQLEALQTGAFEVGFQLPDHVVRAVGRGGDLFIFMAQAEAPDLSLVARPEIREFSALKGHPVAVDGARSGYALLLRRLLAAQGLSSADCPLLEIGGVKERAEALAQGRAAASFLNPPFDRQLLARGYVRLASTRGEFPAYPGPIAAARRAWASEQQGALVAFIRAYRDACRWLATPSNASDAADIACARLQTDRAAAEQAIAELANRPPPRISPAGLREVIDVVWQADGFSPPLGEPARYMDLSYLEHAS